MKAGLTPLETDDDRRADLPAPDGREGGMGTDDLEVVASRHRTQLQRSASGSAVGVSLDIGISEVLDQRLDRSNRRGAIEA